MNASTEEVAVEVVVEQAVAVEAVVEQEVEQQQGEILHLYQEVVEVLLHQVVEVLFYQGVSKRLLLRPLYQQ